MPDGALNEIIQLTKQLNEEDREMLRVYAQFLLSRHPRSAVPGHADESIDIEADIPAPNLVKPPAEETVIQAIKRLTAGYPMLDKSHMLQDTYQLMCQHTLEGKKAELVIADLEALFQSYYNKLKQQR